jgi:predicted RecA/RadA family phage recombinase
MPTLGLDPGHTGGCVLLGDAGRPVAAWAWRPLERKSGRVYRLDEAHGPSLESPTIAGVGSLLNVAVCELTHGEVLHLAVEGLFVARPSKKLPGAKSRRGAGASIPTALELARTVGWLTAGLVQRAASVVMPKASDWRPAVLGCSAYATSDEAERLALLRWRTLWSGDLVDDPHCAEAACLGAWAIAQRRLVRSA